VKKVILLLMLTVVMMACKGGKKTASSKTEPKEKSKKEKSTKSESSTNKKAETILKTARSYTGTPYKYGGTTKAGIDCSGFTCASYKAVEIILPRTATDQSTFGKTVSLDELKKCDLIFFTDKKGHKKITHVGMVTEVKSDGTAKFIHASTKMGVIETDLFSNYYKPLIIKAVRIF
jgi:probable lipoprotein NlpC